MSYNPNPSPQPSVQGTDQDTALNGSAALSRMLARPPISALVQSAHIPPSSVPGDVSMADWDDLLNAVKSRLLMSANEDFAHSRDPRPEGPLEFVQSEMIDCVGALNQLHTTLSHELERHKTLQGDIEAAQAALARKHSELLGTQAQERRSRHLARHDSLTALPNRSHFSQRLDQTLALQLEAAHPEPLAVLFLDLDYFKQINDTHGHAAGDEVLKIVATRLIQSVRVEDCVSRLGGDEFACLLGGFPDRQRLGQHAARILAAVAAPLQVRKLSLTIRPSIGVALYPSDGSTGPVLLERADVAMYAAKKTRSGYAFYDEISSR